VAQAAKHLVMAAAPDCRNEFAIVACENDGSFGIAIVSAGLAAVLPVSAAFVGTSMETFNRLMVFQNWI
jgi:hypothetical protein